MENKNYDIIKFEGNLRVIAVANENSLLSLKQIFEQRKIAAQNYFKIDDDEQKMQIKTYITICNEEIKKVLGIYDIP